MVRRLRGWVVLVIVTGVLGAAGGPAGCASAPRGEAFQPEIVDPTRAVVYAYRLPKRGLSVRRAQIYVDAQPAGELLPGQYLARVLSPGTYLIRAEAGSSTAREIRLVAGDIAYVQVVGASKLVIELPESSIGRKDITRTTRAPE